MRVPLTRLTLPLGVTSFALAILLGVFTGVGGYTANYAEATSYLSTDPAACKNCHIMNDEYNSWSRSGHHHVAGCVDCHLPHDFLPKYFAKGINGWNHSKAFTLQNFHEPIQIGRRNAELLQQSCVRCHADFVHEIVKGSSSPSLESVQCVHCHKGVGHGK